jgi:osmoprotectant transport system substrate-binding protein
VGRRLFASSKGELDRGEHDAPGVTDGRRKTCRFEVGLGGVQVPVGTRFSVFRGQVVALGRPIGDQVPGAASSQSSASTEVVRADAAKGVTWWDRAPANNTYALAQTQTTLAKYGVKTLSDYAALAKKDPAATSMCVESEFQSRDDGFPGVKKAYGFSLASVSEHLLDTAVVYTELGKGGTCNFGEVFTTDGRVASLKLNVVQDDKKFFPIYNPALSVRSDVAKRYPGLEALFKPIADKLTTETLSALNKEVSVDGKKPRAVAEEWMRTEGFIR